MNHKNRKPLFITIEGVEGAGKSTNAKLVIEYLNNLKLQVLHTREPGGTLIAEKIRDILLQKDINEPITNKAELLLLFAARSQHLENLIIPALNVGTFVVCERFTDASFAYQGAGRGLNLKDISYLEHFVQNNLRPDLTLLFDLDVKIGLERVRKRGALDRIEQEKIDFFTKVRDMYLQLAKQNANRYIIIDASDDPSLIKKQIILKLDQVLYDNKLFK